MHGVSEGPCEATLVIIVHDGCLQCVKSGGGEMVLYLRAFKDPIRHLKYPLKRSRCCRTSGERIIVYWIPGQKVCGGQTWALRKDKGAQEARD